MPDYGISHSIFFHIFKQDYSKKRAVSRMLREIAQSIDDGTELIDGQKFLDEEGYTVCEVHRKENMTKPVEVEISGLE